MRRSPGRLAHPAPDISAFSGTVAITGAERGEMIDLPDIATAGDFARWRSDPDRWSPVAPRGDDRLRRRHGGWREYDLLGPITFMCAGGPDRFGRLLDGYGMPPGERGPALRRRLLTLTLLHRASDLRNVAIGGDRQSRVASLCDLEDLDWP